MPQRKRHYLGNPQFRHLRIDDESDKQTQTKEATTTGGPPYYQIEGADAPPLGLDGKNFTEHRHVGSQEEDNNTLAARTNVPSHRLGRRRRGKSGDDGDRSPSNPRRSMTSIAVPQRELKVRLTKNLSNRTHAIRRFVDFTICNSNSSQQMFGIVKDEQDVCHLKNGDFLLRVRLTFNTRHNVEDPYVKDYIAEIKFRGRLFKYNKERDSFLEVAVVSQCMAICAMAECRKTPTLNIAPPF